jgi:hypothetical protein
MSFRSTVVALVLSAAVSGCSTEPCNGCGNLHLQVQGTVLDSTGAAASGLIAKVAIARYDTLLPSLVIATGSGTTSGTGSYAVLLTATESQLALDSRPLQATVSVDEPGSMTRDPLAKGQQWPVTFGPADDAPPTVTMDLVVPIP